MIVVIYSERERERDFCNDATFGVKKMFLDDDKIRIENVLGDVLSRT